jgi:hypothetical protein
MFMPVMFIIFALTPVAYALTPLYVHIWCFNLCAFSRNNRF